MKKIIVSCMALAAFFAVSLGHVSACPKDGAGSPCPFMVFDHAKDLGLSKKQKSQIEKIRASFQNDMQALGKKYGDEANAVLTDEQKKKYAALNMSDDCMGHKKEI